MKKVSLLGFTLLSVLLFVGCGNSDNNTNNDAVDGKSVSNTNKSVNSKEVDSNLLINHNEFKMIADNGPNEDVKVIEQKDYNISWSDNSWSGLNYSADKVSILKLDGYKDYSDNEYEGFVLVHFNIDNTERDISTYPEQATLVTNTGEQTEGDYSLGNWAGDIMQGVKKDGYSAYPLKKLTDINEISSLRLKINSSYDTDDFNDTNAYHDYDITIELK
ncbi:hypothetical protein [Vagococcus fluvialis]|uniref:hypothetical protein n=1 Tax=Vagococcus fluvialis TaxID=2738 RepID=UPI0020342A96|nr:hypothetical protein [Vagococcus fluvialis]MCM2138939.1 hypothetical protein [Vagococcus fluvialis]